MFNRSSKVRATTEELLFMSLVRLLPCICCRKFGINHPAVLHHIKQGNKRMGHFFVLPLCPGHHVGEFKAEWGYGVRICVHKQHKKFVEVFGTERELWEEMKSGFEIDISWPMSKVLPRRS